MSMKEGGRWLGYAARGLESNNGDAKEGERLKVEDLSPCVW